MINGIRKRQRSKSTTIENPVLKACHTGETSVMVFLSKLFVFKQINWTALWAKSERIICPPLLLSLCFWKNRLFDPDLPICEDHDFYASCSLMNICWRAGFENGGHADQLSTSTWGPARFHLKSLENSTPKNITSWKEQVLRTFAYKAELLTKGFIMKNILKPISKKNPQSTTFTTRFFFCFMNFIVALQPEARPLIDRHKLVKRNDTTYSPFLKMKTTDLLFLVCRINAAAATDFT